MPAAICELIGRLARIRFRGRAAERAESVLEAEVLAALPRMPTPHRIAGRVGRAIPNMPAVICELIGELGMDLGLTEPTPEDWRDDLRALKVALDNAQRLQVVDHARDLPTRIQVFIRALFEEDVREMERECGEMERVFGI